MWQCQTCDLRNRNTINTCQACFSTRPAPSKKSRRRRNKKQQQRGTKEQALRNQSVQKKAAPVNKSKPKPKPRPKPKPKRIPIPQETCPICLDNFFQLMPLHNCSHRVCFQCFKGYLMCDLKNLSKYPLKCFHLQCDQALDRTDVTKTLNAQNALVFDKFSILCAIPAAHRLTCPGCTSVFVHEPNDLQRRSVSRSFAQLQSCSQCNSMFSSDNCNVCGERFCSTCMSIRIAIPDLEIEEPLHICDECHKQYLYVACLECRHQFCIRCCKQWHQGVSCDEGLSNREFDEKQQSESAEFMAQQGFRACPGCGLMIAKSEGCNHMTHRRCPAPSEGVDTHFCYTCGELLYGRYHANERDGRRHFDGTIHEPCRKYHEMQAVESSGCVVL